MERNGTERNGTEWNEVKGDFGHTFRPHISATRAHAHLYVSLSTLSTFGRSTGLPLRKRNWRPVSPRTPWLACGGDRQRG
eukprot:102438-Chlamydomonas_euryale.AAC.1